MAGAARKRGATGPAPTILLIGLRGSGKSTVGPMLADRLGRQFIDLDSVTLWRVRAPSVEEAWREHGVPAFRRAEADALRDAMHQPARVIAAGGGTPTAPGMADFIRGPRQAGRAFVVYLREPPETLRARLASIEGDDRPSLTGRGALDEIGEVFADRDPLYRALASQVVEGAGAAADTVERILGVVPA